MTWALMNWVCINEDGKNVMAKLFGGSNRLVYTIQLLTRDRIVRSPIIVVDLDWEWNDMREEGALICPQRKWAYRW